MDNPEKTINEKIGYLRSVSDPNFKFEYCPLDRETLRYLSETQDVAILPSIISLQNLFNISHRCPINRELTELLGNHENHCVKEFSDELLHFLNHINYPYVTTYLLSYKLFFIQSYGWPLSLDFTDSSDPYKIYLSLNFFLESFRIKIKPNHSEVNLFEMPYRLFSREHPLKVLLKDYQDQLCDFKKLFTSESVSTANPFLDKIQETFYNKSFFSLT